MQCEKVLNLISSKLYDNVTFVSLLQDVNAL